MAPAIISSEASHLPFQDAKAMEFGESSSSLASNSYDHIPVPDSSKDKKHQIHTNYLSPKSFASASKTTRQRFSQQAVVAFLLCVWCGCLWGFTVHWPYRNDPRFRSPCPLNDPPTWFTPTVVYGSFTFGQAKAVDVAWNMVVGRAAQAFISYLFYSVLMDVAMRMMEITTLPIDLFISLVFRPFSFTSKVSIVNSLDRIDGWRVTTAMIWIFFSTLYIASIPAINDAMTGYVPHHTAWVLTKDGQHLGFTYDGENPDYFADLLREGADVVCEQNNTYQWGFAAFWVLLSVTSCTAWIIGTYAIWLDAQHHSELVRKGRKMGMNRAIIDAVEAITEALGPDTNAYSERELEKALKKHPGVMFSVEERVESGTEHIKLSYQKDEKLQLSWMRKYGA